MDLVDHEQADRAGDGGQDLLPEARAVEPLRRDEQQIDLPGPGRPLDLVPVVDVLAVDGGRADADAGTHLDLVPHQRQQRRDHEGGAGAVVAEQSGGDEVHDALAPAGALHHEHPSPTGDEGLDRPELAVPEGRPATEELLQQRLGPLGDGDGHGRRVVHGPDATAGL